MHDYSNPHCRCHACMVILLAKAEREADSAKALAAAAEWDAAEWRGRFEAIHDHVSDLVGILDGETIQQAIGRLAQTRDECRERAEQFERTASDWVARYDAVLADRNALTVKAEEWGRDAAHWRRHACEWQREAAEWRRLHDINAQSRGRLAAAVLLTIGKAEALAHGPMSDDAIAAAVKDAVDSARGRGRFEADAAGAVDDVDVMSRAIALLARTLDNTRAELRALKGE